MEPDAPQACPRKLKFTPKIPPRRAPKPEVKREAEDVDATRAADLMRQFHERSIKAKPVVEKKVQGSQIAFGLGAVSSSLKLHSSTKEKAIESNEKEYIEPWDYHSHYPVTLPLRRPFSGPPDILDENEFRESTTHATWNEGPSVSALELGLMEESKEPEMFLLQFPQKLPLTNPPPATKDVPGSDNPKQAGDVMGPGSAHRLNHIPPGFMGKLIVYRSGAVKLKLGGIVYDVSPGMGCVFSQDAVVMNTAEKHCCSVAEITKRATIVPDVDFITDDFGDLL